MHAMGAQVPVKIGRGYRISWNWGYHHRCCQTNMGPLEEQCVLMLAISRGGGVPLSL